MTQGFPSRATIPSASRGSRSAGQLGKQDNCQVAVSLSLANDHASLPVAHRLYLPQEWIDDAGRRAKAGVPEEIAFKTKPQIALDQIPVGLRGRIAARRGADGRGLWRRCDVAYGGERSHLTYVAGVLPNTLAWEARHPAATRLRCAQEGTPRRR